MAFNRIAPPGYIYANAQTSQVANIIPNMTLPAKHIFNGATARQGWTQPLMISKGFTHYDRSSAAPENSGNEHAYEATLPNKKYWSVPRVNDLFGMNSATTQSQAESFADSMPLDCSLVILETQEGEPYLAPNAVQWRWFHDRWKVRCDNQTAIDGIIRYRCHNYFRFGNGIWALGQQSDTLHRRLYTTPLSQWNTISYVDSFGITQTAVNDWTVGHSQYSCNLIVEGVYLGAPDLDRKSMYGCIFAMETADMQGKTPGIFLFGVREWRPNWGENTNYSDGEFTRFGKIKLKPKVLATYGFIGQEFGKTQGGCTVEYGVIPYQPTSKKPIEYFPGVVDESTDRWKATGAGGFTRCPYYGSSGPGHYAMGGGADWVHFGVKLWNDTFGAINGNSQYGRFKVGAGSWIEKSASESDIIDARAQDRGFVRLKLNSAGTKLAVAYLNPMADGVKKTITFQHPTNSGITITRDVCGNGIHAELITL